MALLAQGGHSVRADWGLRSRRQLRTRVSTDHLWRLSKGAQEGAVHAVAIGETRLPGDDVDRMAALLHHQAGGLDAQGLDRLGWRLGDLEDHRATFAVQIKLPAVCRPVMQRAR